jgi:REP element-mobilizing transposase RayT
MATSVALLFCFGAPIASFMAPCVALLFCFGAPMASLRAPSVAVQLCFGAMSEAIGVLLTFTTYGTHLPGADTSSVSRTHRNWGSPTLAPNPGWRNQAVRLMTEPEFTLDPQDRSLVLNCIIDACAYRAWHLFCVQRNHVHAILQTDVPVERALSYLKARATFVLKPHHPDRQRFWTKHGSTRYLWDRTSVISALDYVMNGQGTPMDSWLCESVR